MKTHKERLKEYISNVVNTYSEFKGVDEEYLYDYVFWPVLIEPPVSLLKKRKELFGEEDIDRFYTFQIKSQRTKIFETFFRAAFKKVKDLGLDYNDVNSSGLEIIDDTHRVLLNLNLRDVKLKDEKYLSSLSDDEYKKYFEIYSNFIYPIINHIPAFKEDLIRYPTDLGSINKAVNLYLDSKMYDKEIDRFFIILLTDHEILEYIKDVAYPPIHNERDIKELMQDKLDTEFYVSKLGRERYKIKSVLYPGPDIFKGFIRWFVFALFVYMIPYVVEIYAPLFKIANMEMDSTLNYSLAIMIIWFVLLIIVSIQNKWTRKEISKLQIKYRTIDSVLLKMNDFYNLVRIDSPLPISEIKRKYIEIRDLNILLPESILAIIENLETRKITNI